MASICVPPLRRLLREFGVQLELDLADFRFEFGAQFSGNVGHGHGRRREKVWEITGASSPRIIKELSRGGNPDKSARGVPAVNSYRAAAACPGRPAEAGISRTETESRGYREKSAPVACNQPGKGVYLSKFFTPASFPLSNFLRCFRARTRRFPCPGLTDCLPPPAGPGSERIGAAAFPARPRVRYTA